MTPSPYLNDPKVYIDTDTFIDLINKRTRCLICCEALESKVVNREHVLPKWILRKYDLYDKEITPPPTNTMVGDMIATRSPAARTAIRCLEGSWSSRCND